MGEKKVSIIIPVYKVEKQLRRCLDSILSQSYKNLEIIIVDDGSPDSCPQICDFYKELDDRVIVIHKKNEGLSAARNDGIEISTGDFIAFVDSDDYVASSMIEKMMFNAIQNESDIVCCGFYFEDENGKLKKSPMPFKELNREEALDELIKNSWLNHYSWNKLYKRETFLGVKFPVGELFEDIRTTYKTFLNSQKITLIEDCLYFYQKRSDSIIAQSKGEKVFEIYNAYQELKKDLILIYPDKLKVLLLSEMDILINQYMELYIYSNSQNKRQKMKNTYELFLEDYNQISIIGGLKNKYSLFKSIPCVYSHLKKLRTLF